MAKKPQKVQKKIHDPVNDMRVHRENLKREEVCQNIYNDFKINEPQKVNFYANKPNNNPFLLMRLKNEGKQVNGVDLDEKLNDQMSKTEIPKNLDDKLKTVTQTPRDKWNFPQTTNQQFGWYSQMGNKDGKFIYKRIGCNETHYADGYYNMKHKSLFSNHKQK